MGPVLESLCVKANTDYRDIFLLELYGEARVMLQSENPSQPSSNQRAHPLIQRECITSLKIDPVVVRDRFNHPEIVKVSKAAGVILGL